MPPSSSSRPRPALPAADRKRMQGISAAALLLTGTGVLVAGRPAISGHELPKPANNDMTGSGGLLPDEIDVAEKPADSMTFDQAFATARHEVGMGGVFNWHGRWYNTFHKEEWSSLSLEQRQEFVELVTHEELPVNPYHPVPGRQAISQVGNPASEPSLIEGELNGQRIMGLDFDHDGVIDTVVMEGADGYTYRVVDATGDDGLDTIMRYDPLTNELMEMERLNTPYVLTADQFSQGLEASMSQEVVDSILDVDPVETPTLAIGDDIPAEEFDNTEDDSSYDADTDDTYVNDGDVHEMDDDHE